MSERPINLTAFASLKGGVGKSTLAVTHARGLAAASPEARPVVLDLDWTGTSLADGLALEAPEVAVDDRGRLRFDEVPASFLPIEEQRQRRVRRRDTGEQTWLPYLNDWFLGTEGRGDPRTFAWRGRGPMADSVLYFPSSALFRDVGRAVGLIKSDAHLLRWRANLATVMATLADFEPWGVTDIIFDLPPGLLGFTEAALLQVEEVAKAKRLGQRPIGNATTWIVSTPDRNAGLATVEFHWTARRLFYLAKIMVNRVEEGSPGAQVLAEAWLQEAGYSHPVAVSTFGELRALSQGFRIGYLPPMVVR